VVYTNDNPNVFTVYVSDLEKAIEEIRLKDDLPMPVEMHRYALDRALFIEQAIQEKLDREKGGHGTGS